jgi:hypothetical protein
LRFAHARGNAGNGGDGGNGFTNGATEKTEGERRNERTSGQNAVRRAGLRSRSTAWRASNLFSVRFSVHSVSPFVKSVASLILR